MKINNVKTNKIFDLRPFHVNRFIDKLSSVNWCHIYDSDVSVDDKCNFFNSRISECMKEIPISYIPTSTKDKPWITPLIKHLIHKRWYAFRCRDFLKYNNLKKLIKIKINQAKLNWTNKFSHPADLWNKVNQMKGIKQTTPIDNLLNSYENDCLRLCNNMNETFCMKFSKCTTKQFSDIVKNCDNVSVDPWDFIIAENDVLNQLLSLDVKKSCGPDNVPSIIYKRAAHIIVSPLTRLFNCCIVNRTFPSIWKEAHVVPVPKCSNAKLNDFRPISLLSVLSKIFERLILKSVNHFFTSTLDKNQFGFRQNSSTTCALIKIHDHITRTYENPSVTGIQVCALDYSLAFDRLIHNVIIKKLIDCYFPLAFVEMIYSYLVNRSQCVRINNVLSTFLPVTSGVPQGSIIAPFLFSLVMSDLHCLYSDSCIVKFADDLTLSIPVYYSLNHVIEEIDHVKQWSSEIGLTLNLKKCKFIFIRRSLTACHIEIPGFTLCTSIKLLGVTFSNNLKWDTHINNVLLSTNRRAFAFRTLKPILSSHELLIIYKSLILSIIEYCSPVFIGLNQKNCTIINSIQRRFHNLTCHFNCHCNIFPNILQRRIQAASNLFKSASCDPTHVLHDIIPQKRSFYCQPHCKTELRKSAFIPCTCELVNANNIRKKM